MRSTLQQTNSLPWQSWPLTSIPNFMVILGQTLSLPEGKRTKPQRLDSESPAACEQPRAVAKHPEWTGQIMRPSPRDGSWVCPKICEWCLFKSKKWGVRWVERCENYQDLYADWTTSKWLSDRQTLHVACFPELVERNTCRKAMYLGVWKTKHFPVGFPLNQSIDWICASSYPISLQDINSWDIK